MRTWILILLAFLTKPLNGAWQLPDSAVFTLVEDNYSYYCTPDAGFNPVGQPNSRNFQDALGILNLNYVPDQYCWTQLDIINPAAVMRLVYFEHNQPTTDHIELFHVVNGKVVQDTLLGMMHDTRKRPVFYRTPTFKLELQPGLNQIWVRQQSRDLMVLGWKVFNPDHFVVFTSYENLLFGGFFAICFSLSLYNLIIFLANRESLHLYYFLYLFSYGICQMFVAGLIPLYLLPDSPFYRQGFGLATVVVAMSMAVQFVYSFLDAQKSSRFIRFLYRLFISIALFGLVLNVCGYYTKSAQISLFMSGFVSLIGIIFTVGAIRSRHPMAMYFAVAWAFLLVGNFVQVLVVAGALPNTPLLISANFLGATVEAILISFALAQRMKQQKQVEKEKRNHAFSQLEKMVLPHQLHMMKAGNSLEHTMPLKQDVATVICLDLIGSTRSRIPDMKTFLRRFMDRCQQFMNLDYDGQALTGLGYRIKELGDGFLCSVGFPFAPPRQSPQESVALELSLSFLASFDEEFAREHVDQPTYCSIGIAQGPVEGFFTLSGMRSYEMFGDGIVKATRYEALRKSLTLAQNAHQIAIQSSVWQALPAELKARFKRQSLGETFKIRNDENAREFYLGYLQPGEARELLHSAWMQNRSLAEAI